ncbi:unnamed protein product [Dracunculus medinensis]|uniref:TAP-C domain-containing protein n=1 Tax=Dracunculus medinensis TaxID=318479 RepID=A0A0N4U1K9_DRAME|nr:unnamed protein product [Dracunculus medinensis]
MATFSLSVENLSDAKGTHEGISDNNFCLSEWEYYKEKVFCREAMEIVVQLRKLPPTTHIFETFNVVDVPIVKGNIMRFSLQGFFRDASINIKNSLTDASLSVLPRYFCREFVLIDKGCGKIAIINDTLFIAIGSSKRLEDYKGILRNMIEERRRNYAEEEVQSRMEANISPTPTLPELTPKELALAGYESMQKLLIELFSQQSQMKPEWSRKCLMDLNWDCEEAYKAFLALRDKIPSEAFQ